MQVDGVGRVGAGDDPAAGFEDLHQHLVVARAVEPAAGCASGLRVSHLLLDPLRVEREAGILPQRRIGVEDAPHAAA